MISESLHGHDRALVPGAVVSATIVVSAIALAIATNIEANLSFLPIIAWSVAQWTPITSMGATLQQFAWDSWGERESNDVVLDIPRIAIRDHSDPLKYLETVYGTNWRDKPLLLQGLWSTTELEDPKRRLSLSGLLEENLTIPYFKDARVYGSLSPDGSAPVREIVKRIMDGHPHKIGTQLLVQQHPGLLAEVAPTKLVTDLFGNHFSESLLLGHGNTLGIFPGTTTVPLFVASGTASTGQSEVTNSTGKHPSTGLHCEPIGNVAVQLSGVKEWTLIDPRHHRKLNPSIAPDGRAFFASWATTLDHVPRYKVKTFAGDAIWVPTWTWHQVDYIESNEISIGASLFHFRPFDMITRNPLYGLLVVPSMLRELAGISTQ